MLFSVFSSPKTQSKSPSKGMGCILSLMSDPFRPGPELPFPFSQYCLWFSSPQSFLLCSSVQAFSRSSSISVNCRSR